MLKRRLIAFSAIAAFISLDAGTAAFAAPSIPDPATFPTGSFAMPETSEYITNNGEEYQSSRVLLQRLSLSDDTTPAAEIVVRVYSGTNLGLSSNGEEMSSGTTRGQIRYGGASDFDPVPWFDLAGTYQPYMTLTDADGNTTRIDLPEVTLLHDDVAPVTRLTLPRKNRRNTMAAWRNIQGTIWDAGIDRPGGFNSGGASTGVSVLQKRHGLWYLYKCHLPAGGQHPGWCKGKRTLTATQKKFGWLGQQAMDTKSVGSTGWRTPYVRGLTRGPLAILVTGIDSNLNHTTRQYTGFRITRRR